MHPIFFKIGSIEIRYYGVMIALAFIVAAIVGERESRRKGFAPGLVYDLLSYMLVAVIAGARLYYVLLSDPYWFITHPFEIIAVWKGGLSLHGGLIGGLIAGIWYCRKKGIAVWKFTDVLAPAIILGQAIGRIGCTLNGCCYGRETDLPWGVVYTDPHSSAPLGIPLHPTQIYEVLLSLILFAGLWLGRKKTAFDGHLFLTYIMGYGVIRFFLEFFRGDSLLLFDLVPVPHVMSIVIFLTGIGLYLYKNKTRSLTTLSGGVGKPRLSG